MTNRYDKLPELIVKAVNYTHLLELLKIKPCSGNFATLKKYIKVHNLDTSHFQASKYQKLFGNKIGKKQDLEIYLTNNSTYSRSALKKRLLKEGLKKEECEICGQKNEWNGKPLIMILDHINGVHNDNRLENLRMVCPNCNYQLSTTGGKNKLTNKKLTSDRQCAKCCKVLEGFHKKLCTVCKDSTTMVAAKKRRKIVRPSYEVLRKELSESNFLQLSKKYGVSDNAIRKWIKVYEKYPSNS